MTLRIAISDVRAGVKSPVALLLLSPAILATIWSGLYPDEPMGIATTFETFLDMVFGGQSGS